MVARLFEVIIMPFALPDFNLRASGWTYPHVPAVDAPDEIDVPCQLYVSPKQSSAHEYGQDRKNAPTAVIRIEKENSHLGCWIWAIGSPITHWYRVYGSLPTHQGFPNEYLSLFVEACDNFGDPYIPFGGRPIREGQRYIDNASCTIDNYDSGAGTWNQTYNGPCSAGTHEPDWPTGIYAPFFVTLAVPVGTNVWPQALGSQPASKITVSLYGTNGFEPLAVNDAFPGAFFAKRIIYAICTVPVYPIP